MSFSNRSYEKELLDRDDIPFEDIKRNMQELEFINKYLGGHNITIEGLKATISGSCGSGRDTFTVCEIGCGGGDNLKVIDKWFRKNKMKVKLIGIDINNDCITYAKENCMATPFIEFITSNYKHVNFHQYPDVIFSSLFCHHLNEEELLEMMNWCNMNSVVGFFINDLHRNPIAYYTIKALTKIFSHSYLVKNDAPLSVKRGFKKNELETSLKQAGAGDYKIYWKWAFRWLVIVKHKLT